MIELIGAGIFIYNINQAEKNDAQALKKNMKAFTKSAEAQKKLDLANENVSNKIQINAKRKNALLTCHLKMFQEQYSVIKQIKFEKGKGVEDLEQLDKIRDEVVQYVSLPSVVSGKMMTDSQMLVKFVFRGFSGLYLEDSKRNLKVASANMAQANAVTAQIDTVIIALNGIAEHIDIVTQLLEKLGMVYMLSIKNLKKMFAEKGLDARNYTNQDINEINAALKLTKTIYAIINTPLIDANGTIEKESKKVIEEGQNLLNQIH